MTKRRKHDFYPTPEWAGDHVFGMLQLEHFGWTWAEPCVGTGRLVRSSRPAPAWTNDIDRTRPATHHLDAADSMAWTSFDLVDWIVTNPPFSDAAAILYNALEHARVGVALLLRLSFLEPVEGRRELLENHPPTHVSVLPRISFDGSGKTDSVTCAWMIWSESAEPGISVFGRPRVPKEAA
jgi:hypothetical protein